jgi:hypothetical protein
MEYVSIAGQVAYSAYKYQIVKVRLQPRLSGLRGMFGLL